MAKELASYPSRAVSWLQKNSGAVRDWIQFRCREETDLDDATLSELICKLSSAQDPRGFFENADPFVTNPIPSAAADLRA
jgi:hypothetical protein